MPVEIRGDAEMMRIANLFTEELRRATEVEFQRLTARMDGLLQGARCMRSILISSGIVDQRSLDAIANECSKAITESGVWASEQAVIVAEYMFLSLGATKLGEEEDGAAENRASGLSIIQGGKTNDPAF